MTTQNTRNDRARTTSAARAADFRRQVGNLMTLISGDDTVTCTRKGCKTAVPSKDAQHANGQGFCSSKCVPSGAKGRSLAGSLAHLAKLIEVEEENAAEVARLHALSYAEAYAERASIEAKIAEVRKPLVAKRVEFDAAQKRIADGDEAKERFDAAVTASAAAFAERETKPELFAAAQAELAAAKDELAGFKKTRNEDCDLVERLDAEGQALARRVEAELDRLYEQLRATPKNPPRERTAPPQTAAQQQLRAKHALQQGRRGGPREDEAFRKGREVVEQMRRERAAKAAAAAAPTPAAPTNGEIRSTSGATVYVG